MESNDYSIDPQANGSQSAKNPSITSDSIVKQEGPTEMVITEDLPEIENVIRTSSTVNKEEIAKIDPLAMTGINQNIISLWQQQMMGHHPPGSVNWEQAVIVAQLALLQYHSLSCLGQTLWPGQVHTLIETEPLDPAEPLNPCQDKLSCHPIVYIGNNQWQLKSPGLLKHSSNGFDKIPTATPQPLAQSVPMNPAMDS